MATNFYSDSNKSIKVMQASQGITDKPRQGNKQQVFNIVKHLSEQAIKLCKNNIYITWLSYLFLLIPVVIYFRLVIIYSVNIPYQDDYNAILEFLSNFKTATFSDRIALLFSQHSDHRIFHSRLVYLLYFYIFGKINFAHIIILGNIQLVVIYLLFIQFIKKTVPEYWIIVAFFVGFCLFDISSYENADFAMCGTQNYGVLMLYFVSLYFYNKTGIKFVILAGLFEAICIFSGGNGLICALSLVIFNLLGRDKIKSVSSISLFLISIPLYYFHYQKMTAMGNISAAFTSFRDVRFFFHMLGNHFSYENGIAIGTFELILLILLLPTTLKLISRLKFKPQTLQLISILCASIGTMLSISIFRSNDERLGEQASYGSRYMIYSHIFAAVLFLLVWIKIEGYRKLWYLTTAAAASFLLYANVSNYKYGEFMLIKTKKRLETYRFYYGVRTKEEIDEAKKITAEACNQGIYCIDEERKMALPDDDNALGVSISNSDNGGLVIALPASPEKYVLTLMDAGGRKLGDTVAYARLSDISIDLKLAHGNYILKVQNQNKEMQKPFTLK